MVNDSMETHRSHLLFTNFVDSFCWWTALGPLSRLVGSNWDWFNIVLEQRTDSLASVSSPLLTKLVWSSPFDFFDTSSHMDVRFFPSIDHRLLCSIVAIRKMKLDGFAEECQWTHLPCDWWRRFGIGFRLIDQLSSPSNRFWCQYRRHRQCYCCCASTSD